jgi:pimeloyl-ACP methyl ester carboxylesterase
MDVVHRTIRINGIDMHVAEAGEGPLVLLLHGFPELWYSFRHQLGALAHAGYRTVAPDQRGYGATDAPAAVHDYTLMHLAGDIVGLLHALGEDSAVVVGQDWGSPVATTLALFRPDLVRGLVMLRTPYFPRGDTDFLSELTAQLGPDNYQVFFQEPGMAEAALEADVRATVLGSLLGISGEAAEVHTTTEVDGTTAMPDHSDTVLPGWLSEEDVDYYTAEFSRTGYRGALNWYRNHRQNWEYMSAWHQAPIRVPAMFVGGDRDPVLNWPGTRGLVDTLGDRLVTCAPRSSSRAVVTGSLRNDRSRPTTSCWSSWSGSEGRHCSPPARRCDSDYGSESYEGVSRPGLCGGGSMPGTPPSVTCSVHSVPDQYRLSCRPEGSISQPAGIPVNLMSAGDRPTSSGTGPREVGSVKEAVEGAPPRWPRWRRCEESARIANRPKKSTRAMEEPWP